MCSELGMGMVLSYLKVITLAYCVNLSRSFLLFSPNAVCMSVKKRSMTRDKATLLREAKSYLNGALGYKSDWADSQLRKDIDVAVQQHEATARRTREDQIISQFCSQANELLRQAYGKIDLQDKLSFLTQALDECEAALQTPGHERHSDLSGLQSTIVKEFTCCRSRTR